ncbi:MAG TPA: metalloregulator ArsR/SmtB family transcription factor [Dehalococcoidia bacterium]|nr:metalloregulator ArsR/SmtB family transcription factor [Dehalococcoidia bacterium]
MDSFERDAVKVFKALADPTRYKVVRLLIEKGELGCQDFADEFPLTPPAMSHHYRVLENAGLVLTRKEGSHVFMRLNEERLDRFLPDFRRVHLGPRPAGRREERRGRGNARGPGLNVS